MSRAELLFLALALAFTLPGLVWVLAPVRQAQARLGMAAALAVPILALGAYLQLGSPKALAGAPAAPAHATRAQDMQAMVDGLQRRLQAQPDDAEGWFMLARSRLALEQWASAADAYRRALALLPKDPGLMADLADVLGVMAEGELEGEPRALVVAALALDPQHAKARALLASAEFRRGRLAEAKAHWEALLRTAPADSEAARLARQGIARVGELTGAAR
jgi:cytochrome c-type biogenesis protein CcmH